MFANSLYKLVPSGRTLDITIELWYIKSVTYGLPICRKLLTTLDRLLAIFLNTLPSLHTIFENMMYPFSHYQKKPTQQTLRKWISLAAILGLVQAQDLTCSQEVTYLECNGANVTIPYCLQCTDECVLRCGGPDVTVPWCYPCKDECVTPPMEGIYPRLGGDGKAFIVEMDKVDFEGSEMVWAGSVKWNKAPKVVAETGMALCWGIKTDGDDENIEYQCVNAGL